MYVVQMKRMATLEQLSHLWSIPFLLPAFPLFAMSIGTDLLVGCSSGESLVETGTGIDAEGSGGEVIESEAREMDVGLVNGGQRN